MSDGDDFWDAMDDIFGVLGWWFAPLSIIALVALGEFIYYWNTSHWWVP